jgi:hypothetical protein
MCADIPIACTLSTPELREREATVLKTFGAMVRRIEARPDGYTIEVPATDEGVTAALALIKVERLCGPFLRFDLAVEAGAGPVWLRLTGPPGTKAFLARWLEPRAHQIAAAGGNHGPRRLRGRDGSRRERRRREPRVSCGDPTRTSLLDTTGVARADQVIK